MSPSISTCSTQASYGSLGAGWNGNGSLTIRGGIAVTCTDGYLGYNSGSSGTATVNGAGSTWSIIAGLTVGNSGTGKLSITNGATVNCDSADGAGEADLGFNPGSSGTAVVDGAGSSLNTTKLYVGSFYNSSGTGTLVITNGGAVSTESAGCLGGNRGSLGTVSVDGAGSTWGIGRHQRRQFLRRLLRNRQAIDHQRRYGRLRPQPRLRRRLPRLQCRRLRRGNR